jgi:hypothetical protein
MRMSHYFLSLLVLAVGGLVATAIGGLQGASWHLILALPTAALVVGLHSLVILFVLIGSRLLREGTRNCALKPELLQRNNDYFRRLSGLFLSLGGAFSIVAAGVLGYGHRAFGLHPYVHLFVGLGAALITLVAVPLEWRTLRGVEARLDEARDLLDADDRQRAAKGQGPVDEDHQPRRDTLAQTGRFIALAPWFVYLYHGLIVWRGRFEHANLHPWVEISAVGVVVWWVGHRRQRGTGSGSKVGVGG